MKTLGFVATGSVTDVDLLCIAADAGRDCIRKPCPIHVDRNLLSSGDPGGPRISTEERGKTMRRGGPGPSAWHFDSIVNEQPCCASPSSGNASAITVNLFGELRLLVLHDQRFRMGSGCHRSDVMSRSNLDFASVVWSYTPRQRLEQLDSLP